MRGNDKIKTIEELTEVLAKVRSKKKIIHCHGVFDLLHIGHIRHFNQAKKLGDILVVTVTPDKYVNKGPGRPVFPEELRAEAIAALDCVDYVAINKWPTAEETIKLIKPALYAKGSDYRDPQQDITGKIIDEEAVVKSIGGEMVFTEDIVFSSSSLINKYMPIFPLEVQEYLSGFSERYSVDDVIKYLKSAQSLKVLVVGEAIIDEYCYCESIGKSAKEPILAVRYVSSEKFPGGILALANHLANFCSKVGMVTILGAENSQEDFIRENVNSGVDMKFIYKADSPTIVKRRFVESYLLQKLFEVYEMNDEELRKEQNQDLCKMLAKEIPQYDVVIVADYGHGMITRGAIDTLCSKSKFLSINTQANAGNRGLNTISKYPSADYICLTYDEIMLEERNKLVDVREMIKSVSKKLSCDRVLVTLGKEGNVGYNKEEGFFEVPAFAHKVIDRVGAGDAVLSLTSLCLAQGSPMEIVGFIGNVVGAQAVLMLGNRMPIEPVPLFKHIETLMK